MLSGRRSRRARLGGGHTGVWGGFHQHRPAEPSRPRGEPRGQRWWWGALLPAGFVPPRGVAGGEGWSPPSCASPAKGRLGGWIGWGGGIGRTPPARRVGAGDGAGFLFFFPKKLLAGRAFGCAPRCADPGGAGKEPLYKPLPRFPSPGSRFRAGTADLRILTFRYVRQHIRIERAVTAISVFFDAEFFFFIIGSGSFSQPRGHTHPSAPSSASEAEK